MTGRAVAAAALAALLMAACATAPVGPGAPASVLPEPRPTEAQPPAPARIVPLAALPGWATEDHAAALAAFRQTCGAAVDGALAQACRSARALGPLDGAQSRAFFEDRFVAERLPGAGVFTGYFAPEYQARRALDAEFSAALRRRPLDLQPSDAPAYADRAAIEARPAGDALAWLRPEDLYFLQVQGSGVITFDDGRRMKARYAGNNGRPYVAIGGPMRQMGLLAPDATSAAAIHAWLAAHRGPDAQAIMRLNPRYAFFSLAPDDGLPPVGAANVALPAGRALAVDPAFHQMGELLWLDADQPVLTGAAPTYRRLALALDAGGAIKGEVRADLYVGQGPAAGAEAGLIRHRLTLYRLIPR